MPGATGSTEAELAGCDRDAVGGDAVARDSGAYPFRQWAGVCARQLRGLAPGTGNQSPVYRAWQSVGERVLRELQWEAEGGMPEWEIFYSLKEARNVIEQWRQQYNRVRAHPGARF